MVFFVEVDKVFGYLSEFSVQQLLACDIQNKSRWIATTGSGALADSYR